MQLKKHRTQNVYCAKMEWKIVFCPKTGSKKHCPFCSFVKKDKPCNCKAETLAPCFFAFAVEIAAYDASYKEYGNPCKMPCTEVCESKTFFDTARAFPKVFHSHNRSPEVVVLCRAETNALNYCKPRARNIIVIQLLYHNG